MKQAANRTFRMDSYWRRRVALKVAYLGWSYQGNTTNGTVPLSAENTVEARLLEALVRVRLIPSERPDDCAFARCGRTDRGVSAWANVVSLTVRSGLYGSAAAACSDPGLIAPADPIPDRQQGRPVARWPANRVVCCGSFILLLLARSGNGLLPHSQPPAAGRYSRARLVACGRRF